MRVVMLTDDVQIDRRILLEAETLYSKGCEVILLAEPDEGVTGHERIGNVKVERVKCPELSPLERNLFLISSLVANGFGWCNSILQRIISSSSNRLTSLCNRPRLTVAYTIISKGAWGWSLLVYKSCSLLIRLSQYGTSQCVRGIRLIRRISLHEHAIIERLMFYDPDVIHAHDLPRLRAGVMAKRKLNVPLIYDAHEFYPEIGTLTPRQKKVLERREGRYIKEADKVITVNHYIAEAIAKRYHATPPEVILNATSWPANIQHENCDFFRQRFLIPADHKILLFQGWISATRGLQPLVKAMKLVPQKIHLVFMGYGEARSELESITKENGLECQIHFMEAVPQDELLGWTASADAGIIPYQPVDLNNYYCSPNKLFEFIQAELPIIANDLPFLRDVVGGEGFGLVRRLESIEDYAEAIIEMFDEEKEILDNMCANLQKRKGDYSWEKQEIKLLSIYQEFSLPVTEV